MKNLKIEIENENIFVFVKFEKILGNGKMRVFFFDEKTVE
jgi:hypothetical protein